MNKDKDMKDFASKEFDEGYEAWANLIDISKNPYEEFSISWIEWNQGWHEASNWKYLD